MKKHSFLTLLISIILFSCENKQIKSSKLSENQFFGRGEWLDKSDTINGISIRDNKIAFFKNFQFNADQIKEYFIVDSIYKNENLEKKNGEYLFIINIPDTLRYRILRRDNQMIILSDVNGKQRTFKFWR
jgi:hypothetical protein